MKIALALFFISMSALANTNQEARVLLKNISSKKEAILSKVKAMNTPLIKFSVQPAIVMQDAPFTLFAQPLTGFEDTELLLSAKLNHKAVQLERPGQTEMWIYDAPKGFEIKNNTYTAQLFARDKPQADAIRDAIQTLTLEIADLQSQIDNTSDVDLRNQLIAQRDEKISLKSELQTALNNLKFKIGEESYQFATLENPNSPNVPHITRINPDAGPANGGDTVNLVGTGFAANMQVKVGGILAATTYQNSTSATFVVPMQMKAGAKNVEVRILGATAQDPVKNAILKQGYLAIGDQNQPPVFASTGIFAESNSEGVPISVGLSSGDTFSDPDGQVVDCYWTLGGITVHGDPQDFCFVQQDLVTAGDIPATLTIVDNLGATASQGADLHIENSPIPTGLFTMDPAGGSAPLTVAFDASGSTIPGGGTINNYRWRFGDTGANFFGATQSHTYNNGGVFRVQLREIGLNGALPGSGWSSVNRTSAKVYNNGNAPSFGTEPYAQVRFPGGREVLVNAPMNFDGSVSFDPTFGGGIASYSWDFNDYNCTNNCTSTEAIDVHSYLDPGKYFPSLTVTNAGGGQSTIFKEVYVVNQGHAPRAIVKADVTEGIAPLTVNFDASGSYDFDGPIAYFGFGDGDQNQFPQDAQAQVSYTYENPGVYYPFFIVRDNDNNQVSEGLPITVFPAKYQLEKKTRKLSGDDGERERQEQMRILSNACRLGKGRACFDLSKYYLEDGDSFSAGELKSRACTLGYQAACGK